jgi:hypothetical protein
LEPWEGFWAISITLARAARADAPQAVSGRRTSAVFGLCARLPRPFFIATTEPEQVELWGHLRLGAHSVDADGWVWQTASRNLTARLTGRPFTVDGHTTKLRADTDNNLLAWLPEDLWDGTWQEARTNTSGTVLSEEVVRSPAP